MSKIENYKGKNIFILHKDGKYRNIEKNSSFLNVFNSKKNDNKKEVVYNSVNIRKLNLFSNFALPITLSPQFSQLTTYSSFPNHFL